MSDATVGAALAAFRDANGLCHDERSARHWLVRAGFFAFPLPNFAWRRRAIDAHDVHHLITNFPCTMAGEVQIAAWEFGAGRYPHAGATLCCLPLLLLGLMWMPRAMLAAYRRGRGQRSLYRLDKLPALLELPLRDALAMVDGSGSQRLPSSTVQAR